MTDETEKPTSEAAEAPAASSAQATSSPVSVSPVPPALAAGALFVPPAPERPKLTPKQQSRADKLAFREREAVRRAEESRDEAGKRASKVQAENAVLVAEVATLRKGNAAAGTRIAELEAGKERIAALKEVAEIRERDKQLSADLESVRARVEQLSADLESARARIAQLEAELVRRPAEVSSVAEASIPVPAEPGAGA